MTKLSIEAAEQMLQEMTKTESLRRHARTVQIVMEALAERFEADKTLFSVTGVLHDADYESWPEQHPDIIVKKLNELGEAEVAHAIAGHYTKWNVPRNSLLDKCIVAADELTGFIYAVSLMRPTRFEGMKTKSVLKRLKSKSFAASVDREEVRKGAELLGWELPELIQFIIDVLVKHEDRLDDLN